MQERKEVRDYYLMKLLPALLENHNIEFTHEEERNN
jgi:hypothetical protein